MCDNVIDIAKYIIYLWDTEKGGLLSEIRLHKYLYFMQRESFILYDKPLFTEAISGRKYGPVVDIVYEKYLEIMYEIFVNRNKKIEDKEEYKCNLSKETKEIVAEIFKNYDEHSDGTLIRLTKGEQSWKNSRIGVEEYENSDRIMKLEDIKEDAKRIKNRRAVLEGMGLL